MFSFMTDISVSLRWLSSRVLLFGLALFLVSGNSAAATVDFTVNKSSGNAPLLVSFTPITTGTIRSWKWNFGDPSISSATSRNAVVTYTNPGTYTVSLSVTDYRGRITTATKPNLITVTAAANSSSRTLIWADEFNGPLDLTTSNHVGKWRPNDWWQDINVGYMDFAGASWNINPNQNPSYSPFSVANGVLTIKAVKTPTAIVPNVEAVVGSGKAPKWSGGILISEQLQRSFKYGYFEVRAQWPNPGKGMFPAIWLYDANGSTVSDPAKTGAEIDILEIFGYNTGQPWNSTIHLADYQGNGDHIGVGEFNIDTKQWHTYGLDWQPTYLRFYRDGVMMAQVTGANASWFDVPMGIRINFAVDGNWLPVVSDSTTPNPMMMQVDYVRVYDRM